MIGMGRVTKLSKPGRIIGTYLCKSGSHQKKEDGNHSACVFKKILKYRDCESVRVHFITNVQESGIICICLFLFIHADI